MKNVAHVNSTLAIYYYYGTESSICYVILIEKIPVVYVYFSVEEPSLVAMNGIWLLHRPLSQHSAFSKDLCLTFITDGGPQFESPLPAAKRLQVQVQVQGGETFLF